MMTRHHLILSAFLLVPSLVAATSSGVTTSCDALGNYGCAHFKSEAHLECTETNPGLMPWVTRPVRTNMYTLSADTTQYHPGSLVTLHVRVNVVGMKYSGLLLHAVNAAGTTVGGFENLDKVLWTPPSCPNTAMHVSAAPKPYTVTIFYRPPPTNVGTITFRCLIKRGPANAGEFYYPNLEGPLALTAATPKTTKFRIGQFGESCDQVCGSSEPCDTAATALANSASALNNAIKFDFGCPSPLANDCSSLGVGFRKDSARADDYCFYHDETCSLAQAPNGRQAFSCSMKDPDVARFCHCGEFVSVSPSVSPTGVISSGNSVSPSVSPTGVISSGNSLSPTGAGTGDLSSGNMHAPNHVGIFALLIASSFGMRTPGGARFIAMSLLLGKFAGVADAHNWLNVGRTNPLGGQYASTELPCRVRRTTDTHAQVGKNQPFTYKWAANHDAPHYVVVVAGEHEDKLADPNLLSIVREYLEDAKIANKDQAQEPKYMRYRGYRDSGENIFNLNNFKSQIMSTSPLWMTHAFSETIEQWQYKDESLVNDLRANYQHPTYYWIEAAGIYPTIYSDPSHEEIVSIEIEGHSAGTGHYVAHWSWNGYGDCVDFDLHETAVDSNLVYGDFIRDRWNFTRVDHCEFVGFKKVMSPVVEVTNKMDISACLNPSLGGNDNNHIYGVNVVPSKLPASAQRLSQAPTIETEWEYCANTERETAWCKCDGQIRYGSVKEDKWSGTIVDLSSRNAVHGDDSSEWWNTLGHRCDKDLFGNPNTADEDEACYCKARSRPISKPNIPWSHAPLGFDSNWMALDGSLSMSQQTSSYWGAWRARTTVTNGVLACHQRWDQQLSLWDALKKCDLSSNCDHLAWSNPVTRQDISALYTGQHRFKGCGTVSGPQGGADDGYTNLQRNINEPAARSGAEIKVSFHPSGADAPGWLTDSGEVFGPRGNGQTYGWRCKNPDVELMKRINKPEFDKAIPAESESLDRFAAYAMDVQMCNDGKDQVWEVQVPNGVYEVTTGMAGKTAGCWVEGVRQGFGDARFFSHELTYRVSVEDGRLTLGSVRYYNYGHRPCFDLTKLSAKLVAAAPPAAWAPATKNPWVQLELTDATAEVGIVKVTTDGFKEEPSRWIMQGSSILPYEATSCKQMTTDANPRGCKDGRPFSEQHNYIKGLLGAWDDEASTGAVVGISDVPCTGNTCVPTTTCGVINRQQILGDKPYKGSIPDYFIDCKGATGKYVYVQLPGDERLADFQLKVHRHEPVKANDDETMVCYSLQARQSTTVLPEYFTTTDPEDPMFYSTCFVRVPIIKWLRSAEPAKVPKWKWHQSCMACDDYQQYEVGSESDFAVSHWHMSDQCQNCDQVV